MYVLYIYIALRGCLNTRQPFPFNEMFVAKPMVIPNICWQDIESAKSHGLTYLEWARTD